MSEVLDMFEECDVVKRYLNAKTDEERRDIDELGEAIMGCGWKDCFGIK